MAQLCKASTEVDCYNNTVILTLIPYKKSACMDFVCIAPPLEGVALLAQRGKFSTRDMTG
jgi:hypothetical protein